MKTLLLAATALLVSTPVARAITATVTFQNGVAGYTGTFDHYIGESLPTGIDGSSVTDFTLNGRNGTGRDTEALIRFGNLFGNDTGQIPAGARILDAQLLLATFGGANANATAGPYGVAALAALSAAALLTCNLAHPRRKRGAKFPSLLGRG